MTLAADIATLAAFARTSAGPGERRAATIMAQRLRGMGLEDVAVEPFRGQTTYVWAQLAHVAAGLGPSRLLAAAALAAFDLELSGRAPWLRRALPTGEGANVVARIPARGPRRRTLVLVAHLDAARGGLAWHPALVRGDVRRRIMVPRALLPAVGLALRAVGGRRGRRVGRALLGLTAAALIDIVTQRTVPGADDNASGVAGVLALAARLRDRPPDGVEVLVALTGCEESGLDGMRAFLAAHPLGPDDFVLGLDTIGSGTPIVLTSEATLLPHRYRPQDVARVPAAAQRWRGGAWTDPILATYAGVPAVSILSVGPDGAHAQWHRFTDTPDRVNLACVERCVDLAEATARTLAE